MELTKRLEAIACFVSPGSIVADVGTDHGYIPIYLVEKGIINQAYAMDINAGPLERAHKNIQTKGFASSIETILSDGLEALEGRKVDVLIIAGMGGMLIKKILEEAKEQLLCIPDMILSPHLDVDMVRRTIHGLGYCIEKETMVEEEGKFYPILVCHHGHEIYNNRIEYKYGKKMLEGNHPTYRLFLMKQKTSLEAIVNRLEHSNTPASQKRLESVQNEISELDEVIKCLLQ